MARTLAVQIAVMLLNIATGVLTARLLGPSGRGVFSAITLWPQMIALVAAGGLPYAMVYHASGSDPVAAQRSIGAALLLGALLGIAGAGFGAVIIPYAMDRNYPDAAILFAQGSVVVVTVNLLMNLLRQALTARGHLTEFNISSWIDPALYLALLGLICAAGPLSPERAALCMYVAGFLGLAWTGSRVWRLIRPSLRDVSIWLPRIASYTGRAAGSGMLANLAIYLDRIVLVFALPPRQLGLYAVAFSLSRMANIVQTAIGAVVLPAMAGGTPDECKALHDRTFRLVLLAMSAGVAAAIPLAQPSLVLLYGGGFADAGPVLLTLVIDAALTCLCQVVIQLFVALGQPGFASAAQAVSFAVTIVGLAVLVHPYGALGAALAVTAGSSVRLVLLLGGVVRRLRLPLPRLSGLRGDLSAIAGSRFR